MIYFFCAPPSAQSVFFSRLAYDILKDVRTDVEYLVANDAQALVNGLKKSECHDIVVYCDLPDENIVKVLLSRKPPILLLMVPFRSVVTYCIEARVMNFFDATRLATQSVSSLYQVARSNLISPIAVELDSCVFANIIDTICLTLDIELTGHARERILESYGHTETGERSLIECIERKVEFAKEARLAENSFSQQQTATLDTLMEAYDQISWGCQAINVIWPPELLVSGTTNQLGLSEVIELTGPARTLCYGPYMHLPAGQWIATLYFRVAKNFSGNTITTEIDADGRIQSKGRVQLPEEGDLEVTLEFTVARADLPVEVRVFLMQGAIEGTLLISAINFTMIEASKYRWES